MASLVPKTYIQRGSVDYDEVFAPVARLDSMRALLAVAAHIMHKQKQEEESEFRTCVCYLNPRRPQFVLLHRLRLRRGHPLLAPNLHHVPIGVLHTTKHLPLAPRTLDEGLDGGAGLQRGLRRKA